MSGYWVQYDPDTAQVIQTYVLRIFVWRDLPQNKVGRSPKRVPRRRSKSRVCFSSQHIRPPEDVVRVDRPGNHEKGTQLQRKRKLSQGSD